MLTLTHEKQKPSEWFEARLVRFQKLWQHKTGQSFEWAASVEEQKRGINHCHALIRFVGKGRPGAYRSGLRGAVPIDWEQRQAKPAMARFIKTKAAMSMLASAPQFIPVDDYLANTTPKELVEMIARSVQVAAMPESFKAAAPFWYQLNYGAMGHCHIVKSQEAVIAYAMKYAMKALHQQNCWWFLSAGAVALPRRKA